MKIEFSPLRRLRYVFVPDHQHGRRDVTRRPAILKHVSELSLLVFFSLFLS